MADENSKGSTTTIFKMTTVPIHGSRSDEDGVKTEGKKQILLNAFDMSTVGHLSPGQWKVGGPREPKAVEDDTDERFAESCRQIRD